MRFGASPGASEHLMANDGMTPARWRNTSAYLQEVFGSEDEHLAGLMERAIAEGLPDIAVSSDVGRFLQVLTMMAGDGTGARVAIEVGTLAGYSGIWIARGLRQGGVLHTIEYEPKHAAFAQRAFEDAGVADRVRMHVGAGLDVLPRLVGELGPASVDVVLLDAVKPEYGGYLEIVRPAMRSGSLLIADNALGANWWIDDPAGSDPARDAMDAFNRMVAADPAFDAACVPIREGVMIARKR